MNRFAPLALGTAVLLIMLLVAATLELSKPTATLLIPTLTGETEYCLTCHGSLPEISAAHPVEVFGCVSCHGGERLALDADLAHSSMRGGANPSDFSVVEESCGGAQCHSGDAEDRRDHIQRATTSVQSTYAGAIASILYTFGAQPDLSGRFGTAAVTDDMVRTSTGIAALDRFTPSDFPNPWIDMFARNCTSCHINAPPADAEPFARFTGCAACHSPLSDEQMAGKAAETHVLTTAIPYQQCNTCHNRGNYDLRTMTFVARDDHPADRLQEYYQPVAQFVRCEYTLDCVDCHTRIEVMGDGDIHSSKDEIQYVQCKTCHGSLTELPQTIVLTDPEDVAFRMALLNPVVDLELGDTVLATTQGEALWNTRVRGDGSYELIGKVTGQPRVFRPVKGSGCTQNPNEQDSQFCHECHAVER